MLSPRSNDVIVWTRGAVRPSELAIIRHLYSTFSLLLSRVVPRLQYHRYKTPPLKPLSIFHRSHLPSEVRCFIALSGAIRHLPCESKMPTSESHSVSKTTGRPVAKSRGPLSSGKADCARLDTNIYCATFRVEIFAIPWAATSR